MENPSYLEDVQNDTSNRGELEYATKHQITNLAREILLRLNLYEIDSSEQTPSTETTEPAGEQEVLDSEVVDDPVEPTRSDSDELNDMLKSAKRRRIEPTTPKRPLTNRGLLENLKREMKFYETNGTRSRSLELLRKALNSVPVTSVEAERVRHTYLNVNFNSTKTNPIHCTFSYRCFHQLTTSLPN